MKSLKWHQVNAWRLSQHGLSPRLKQRDFVKAVTRTPREHILTPLTANDIIGYVNYGKPV